MTMQDFIQSVHDLGYLVEISEPKNKNYRYQVLKITYQNGSVVGFINDYMHQQYILFIDDESLLSTMHKYAFTLPDRRDEAWKEYEATYARD